MSTTIHKMLGAPTGNPEAAKIKTDNSSSAAEWMVGKLTMENELLKRAVEYVLRRRRKGSSPIILKSLDLYCMNFDIVEEILFKLARAKKDLRIREVPFAFKKRMFGETKRNLPWFMLTYVYTMFRLRLSVYLGFNFRRPVRKVERLEKTLD